MWYDKKSKKVSKEIDLMILDELTQEQYDEMEKALLELAFTEGHELFYCSSLEVIKHTGISGVYALNPATEEYLHLPGYLEYLQEKGLIYLPESQ